MCAALRDQLKKLRAAGGNQNNIRIEAETKLKYSRVVDAMDHADEHAPSLRQACFSCVSPDPVLARRGRNVEAWPARSGSLRASIFR